MDALDMDVLSRDPGTLTEDGLSPIPHRILVATDTGPTSGGAERAGADLANQGGASLIYLSVIDPSRLRSPGGPFHTRVDQVRSQRETALGKIVQTARRDGVTAQFLIWEGDPGVSVIEAAKAEGADLIVVGSHARGPVGRLLLGSVSRYVLDHAPRPVIFVRPDQRLDDVWPFAPPGADSVTTVAGGSAARSSRSWPGRVRIRPIRAGDRDDLAAFYAGLTPESRFARFHAVSRGIGKTAAVLLCGPDHEHGEGLTAESLHADRTRAHIVGHLCLEPGEPGLEMAVAVADDWQRQGVGRALLIAAVTWASDHGFDRLVASTLATNGAILALIASSGCPARLSAPAAGIVLVTIDIGRARPNAA